MKRVLVVLVLAGVVAAGAGAAWAHPTRGDRAERREAVRSCVREAREAQPDAEREQLKEAVKACLQARGFTPRPLTPEQQERRAKLRECVEKARADHPGADRATIRGAVRECVKGG